jgi:hypothetical protein
MGNPLTNDINIYDDAIFVSFEYKGIKHFSSYNANTDPSVARLHVGTLQPGVWSFQHHLLHGKTPSFGQSKPVTLKRFGQGLDTGMFGICIHCGGRRATGSLGCLTIWPPQWQAFFNTVSSFMRNAALSSFPLFLKENM